MDRQGRSVAQTPVASTTGTVMVRDTQDHHGCALSVPASAWTAFVASAK
jgi:hypothetical protein